VGELSGSLQINCFLAPGRLSVRSRQPDDITKITQPALSAILARLYRF
jgi:hypothetical protein